MSNSGLISLLFFLWKVSYPGQFPDCSWKVSNPESRHQNCKRIGLVHKASVSYCSLGLLLNSSTGAARINPGHGTKIARGLDWYTKHRSATVH